ncbi:MAG TPA: hypothetical protein VES20_03720 [Bryobacteraceae bacterium]|nr:hypothetical protein [Bryobacteraceae bacterium]
MTEQRAPGPWLTWTTDALLIFALAAALIWPLFKVKYLDIWGSIESTFIADARFLRDHWPHPNWQPNWYGGTRTDYVYPPALRYGTAALAKYVPRMLPVRAYHLYTAFFYCFGIAAVYALVRYGMRSRVFAALSAVAVALISPSYLFVRTIRDDTPLWMPYRLNVLVRYGEGPHMTALAWIPFALLFTFRALEQWRPGSLVLAGAGCAMVVSNNFYGATALALLFPVLVWSVYITHQDKFVWLRALVIPCIAYGLTAFWLVPSYLQITLNNMRYVSAQGNLWSRWVLLAAVLAFVLLSDHLVRGRRDAAWLTFLCGSAGLFALATLGNHYLDFRVIGEPSRLFPELDMLLLLLLAEVLRRIWSGAGGWPVLRRSVVAAVALAALVPSWNYLMRPHSIFRRDNFPDRRPEYQLQDWMAKNMPGSRALPAGSVRFWYNVWNDLPQLGGGSEQGLLNPTVQPPQWQVYLGPEPDLSILGLKITGVDAIIVNSRESREIYHDYVYPDKFRGRLPVVHDNGAGDVIYKVERRFPGLARVVDRARFESLPEIPGNGELPQLQAWHDVLENGPEQRAHMEWLGTDAFRVRARVEGGQSIRIAESFDSNWRATSGGQPVSLRMDKTGFIVADPAPGTHDILFEFPLPRANLVGRIVTLLTIAASGALLCFHRRWPWRPQSV